MNLPATPAWKALRDADWLNGARARIYPRLLLAASVGLALIWIVAARGGVDLAGKPLGADFVSFLDRFRTDAARPLRRRLRRRGALGGAESAVRSLRSAIPPSSIRRPICSSVCRSRSLPYFASLIVWLAATGFAYWRVLRAWAGPRFDAARLLAFPAFLVNVGHGQNGFLSAALIGAGALVLDRRPIVAGLLFGALVFKPQLALMIPIALIASRRWTTFAVAAVTAAALCAAT